MRNVSEKTKYKEKRGTGDGADYKPWIEVGEFGSSGTCSKIRDWINGRIVHCLSQAEAYTFYLLRYMDEVADIKEQYPLNKKDTLRIAGEMEVNHPVKNKEPITMTTDFLVIMKDGSKLAINVKPSIRIKDNPRFIEKSNIEKNYWEERGVSYQIWTADKYNITKADNIRFTSVFYDLENYPGIDDITIVKHLIIRKLIDVNIEENINYLDLVDKYRREINQWRTLN